MMKNAKMRRAGGLTMLTVSLFFCGNAMACEAPAVPEVPDGRQATKDHMVQAQSAVKSYMGDANNYLACLEKEIARTVAKGQKRDFNKAYNETVEQMNEVAEAFNSALKKFKSA